MCPNYSKMWCGCIYFIGFKWNAKLDTSVTYFCSIQFNVELSSHNFLDEMWGKLAISHVSSITENAALPLYIPVGALYTIKCDGTKVFRTKKTRNNKIKEYVAYSAFHYQCNIWNKYSIDFFFVYSPPAHLS